MLFTKAKRVRDVYCNLRRITRREYCEVVLDLLSWRHGAFINNTLDFGIRRDPASVWHTPLHRALEPDGRKVIDEMFEADVTVQLSALGAPLLIEAKHIGGGKRDHVQSETKHVNLLRIYNTFKIRVSSIIAIAFAGKLQTGRSTASHNGGGKKQGPDGVVAHWPPSPADKTYKSDIRQ